jgi:hypothetical protein
MALRFQRENGRVGEILEVFSGFGKISGFSHRRVDKPGGFR